MKNLSKLNFIALLISFPMLCFVNIIRAQVTVTMEQVVPEVGEEYHGYTTNYVDVSTQIGADQLWDFNDLILNDSENHIEIIDPAVGEGNENFMGTDVAYTLEFDGIFCNEYLTTEDGILDYMGRFEESGGEESILSYDNFHLTFPSSMTLGDSGMDEYSGTFTHIGGASVINGTQEWIAVGDGTLLINDQTFSDVILARWIDVETIDDENTIAGIGYMFFYAGNFLPVVVFFEATESYLGYPDEYYNGAIFWDKEIELGISEQTQDIELSIFPNPIQHELSSVQLKIERLNNAILLSDKFQVELWDVQGRKIADLVQDNTLSNFNSNVELRLPSNMEAGTYFVRIIGDNINVSEKLIVQ